MEDHPDYRFQWLSGKISDLLGIEDIIFAANLLSEHNEKIESFFEDEVVEYADIEKQIIFLWRTFYDKMVEETVTVLEEGMSYYF